MLRASDSESARATGGQLSTRFIHRGGHLSTTQCRRVGQGDIVSGVLSSPLPRATTTSALVLQGLSGRSCWASGSIFVFADSGRHPRTRPLRKMGICRKKREKGHSSVAFVDKTEEIGRLDRRQGRRRVRASLVPVGSCPCVRSGGGALMLYTARGRPSVGSTFEKHGPRVGAGSPCGI